MILTGKEIIKNVYNGKIKISDFNIENINPNSYNYCLGDKIIKIFPTENGTIVKEEVTISDEGMVLYPNVLYLGVTKEKLGSDYFATSLIGRSSVGRLGLHLQISADLGHTGTYHKWTLEIRASMPIKVYKGMRIGQVSFWENMGEVTPYIGHYKNYSVPKEAIIDKFDL